MSGEVTKLNMLRVHINDANPGFVNIAHATGLWVFHQRAEAGATLTSKEDLTHLILDVYEKKNPGLKRFFPDQHQVSLSEDKKTEGNHQILSWE